MSIKYLKNSTTTTQADILPGQIANSCGAAVYAVDDFKRLERFLILGSEGGSYYATERKLTKENAAAVSRAIATDGLRVVKTIVEISKAGRAPKNDPAIFALALAAKTGDEATRAAAYKALPEVCRIGTHLYHFVAFCEAIKGGGGWGRGMRRAVGDWFNTKKVDDLAMQLVKYQARDGWGSRDLLRLAHPTPKDESYKALYRWVTQGYAETAGNGLVLPPLVEAFEEAKSLGDTDGKRMLALIKDYKLPREAIPTQWLTKPEIWEALLPHMGLTAMIRNLATMTRVGLVAPLSEATKTVVAKLGDTAALRKSRVHPIQVLSALLTYKQGHGVRGTTTWTPVPAVTSALDAAFYGTFDNVTPTGKNTLLALDVSGSMTWGNIAGVPGLTPRSGSAAMALITAAVEPNHHILGFSNQLVDVGLRKGMTLDQAIDKIERIPMGSTDCSLPMKWAEKQNAKVEAFQVYTDSETNAYHGEQPAAVLKRYRNRVPDAKLIVVGMVSNGFSVSDPNDPGMLDVVGFDTNTPAIIADFVRGGIGSSEMTEADELPDL